jgi:large subunit ribosomal protein L16
MIKLPNKTKHKKMHRHILREFKLKKFKFMNNSVKLFSIQKGYLTLNQIVFFRIFIRKSFHKKVKIFIPLLVNYHKTQKGLGMRMGKGKGKGKDWFIGITYGSVLFELISNKRTFIKMYDILKFIQKKIYIRTKIKSYEKNIQKVYTN